jgi:integrase
VWRYRHKEADSRYKKVSVLLGTVDEIPTEQAAWMQAGTHQVHAQHQTKAGAQVTFGALCNRYMAEAMPQRYSTKASYMTNLTKHILPKWQTVPLAEVRPMFVQQWLDGVAVAQRTKAKIKALMHRLFEKAMFWELRELGRNPMALVEVPGASRRLRKPIILTAEQYFAVLELLPEPYRTMVTVAQCLGLRVSEVVALQWQDINFDQLTIRVTRAAVNGIVDDVKSEYSEDDLPLDPDLATVLLTWKRQCPDSAEGWIFPSKITGRCYHASPIQQDYIRPAGRKLGLGDIGWHTFRHTYRTWLD